MFLNSDFYFISILQSDFFFVGWGGLCSFVLHICLLFVFLSWFITGYSGPVLCTWKWPKFAALSVDNKSQHLLGEQADIGREAAKCVRAWGKTSRTTGRGKKKKHCWAILRLSSCFLDTLSNQRARLLLFTPRFSVHKGGAMLPALCWMSLVLLIGILKGTRTGTLHTTCMMLQWRCAWIRSQISVTVTGRPSAWLSPPTQKVERQKNREMQTHLLKYAWNHYCTYKYKH